jgi:hypothetical protein
MDLRFWVTAMRPTPTLHRFLKGETNSNFRAPKSLQEPIFPMKEQKLSLQGPALLALCSNPWQEPSNMW